MDPLDAIKVLEGERAAIYRGDLLYPWERAARLKEIQAEISRLWELRRRQQMGHAVHVEPPKLLAPKPAPEPEPAPAVAEPAAPKRVGRPRTQTGPCATCGEAPAQYRGYCRPCYHRHYRAGTLTVLHPRHKRESGCEICGRPQEARGLCLKHYMRWYRNGDPHAVTLVRGRPPATCSVEGCEAHVKARGWCVKHYERWHRLGDPLALRGPEGGGRKKAA